jgi:O-antigen/teichoic acid export membrane protein
MVARKRHTQASVTYAASDIARAALMVLPAALLGRLDALLVGAIAFAALRVAATIGYGHREFGAGLRPDSRALRSQLRYALPLQAAVALEIVQANLHAYVVAVRFDAATFAVYAIGCLQIPLVDAIAGSACSVMMVRMRERLTEAGARAAMSIWRETTRMLALLLVPLLGVLWIVAGDLITVLFTEAYAASVPVFRIWVLLLVLAALPVHGPLRVLGDTRFIAIQTALKVGIVAVLIDGALSVFGLAGGVLVSVVAMLIGKTMLLARLRRLTAVPVAELLPWRSYLGILVAAAAAAVPAVLVRSISAPGIERVVAAAATYAAVYALAAWGFRLQRFSVRSKAGYPHVLAGGSRRS